MKHWRQVPSTKNPSMSLHGNISLHCPRKKATTNRKVRERFVVIEERYRDKEKILFHKNLNFLLVADLMNAANVSKREGRSLLIQIKAKSSVSEETTKDAKSYSHMPCGSRLFQLHRLQLMINLWLDDVAASNTITNNEISQHPLESQSPSAEEKINNKLKGEKKIFCHKKAISRENEMNYFIRISILLRRLKNKKTYIKLSYHFLRSWKDITIFPDTPVDRDAKTVVRWYIFVKYYRQKQARGLPAFIEKSAFIARERKRQ